MRIWNTGKIKTGESWDILGSWLILVCQNLVDSHIFRASRSSFGYSPGVAPLLCLTRIGPRVKMTNLKTWIDIENDIFCVEYTGGFASICGRSLRENDDKPWDLRGKKADFSQKERLRFSMIYHDLALSSFAMLRYRYV